MQEFANLFSPIRIGKLRIRNRIFQPAHTTGFAEKYLPTERLLHYYQARARGGVGLIIQEATAVSVARLYSSEVFSQAYRSKLLSILRRIGDRVHEHGAMIFLQLWPCGDFSVTFGNGHGAQRPPAMSNRTRFESPVSMNKEDIQVAIRYLCETAAQAREAGYDGVEFNFGHGSLLQQFLSPSQNFREDEYGRSLENRMRFGMEAIESVRQAVGSDFVVGLRASADELIPEGYKFEEAKEFFSIWARSGRLDYLSVTAGTTTSAAYAVPPLIMPPGATVHLSPEIKQVVDLPVLTAIRINDPITAEQIIRNNEADMVGMVRALICDPELPKKVEEGRLGNIRQCIACNEGCWDRFCHGKAICCVQNPEAGFEGKRRITPASHRKKVAVVGGGCAGMVAAAVAKQRGHHVILFERTGELGGAIRIMALTPNRQEFGQAVRFLKHELERLTVDVRMRSEATVETLSREDPDVVILATGGLVIEDPSPESVGSELSIDIADGSHPVTVEDVLRRKAECGNRVVIADCQSHLKGLVAAEFLASQGKIVTVVMPAIGRRFTDRPPYEVEPVTLQLQMESLKRKGVKLVSDHRVKRVRVGKVVICGVVTGQEQELDADSVVLSFPRKANDGLNAELTGRVKRVFRIGDALVPRLLMDAIHEGYKVAAQI